MNDADDTRDDPPFGDDTDEAVSAWLDGELAAFAAERSLTEAEATDLLVDWPPGPAARDALARARDALATPVPLDDLGRRRLVHTALGTPVAASETGTGHRFRRALAVAAAAVVVLGLGAFLVAQDGEDSTSFTATEATDARGDLGDVGDVTDPARIRDLLGDESSRVASSEAAADAPEKGLPSSSPPAPVPADASSRCAEELAQDREEVFRATGAYQGTPAVLVGMRVGGRTIVFVVAAEDCRVLTSVSR
ncbi:MAG: hypothetical protein FJW88_00165 [Actinobacteria bacterium]|nr:hypothetical protein [Actinomycetota bacterium]